MIVEASISLIGFMTSVFIAVDQQTCKSASKNSQAAFILLIASGPVVIAALTAIKNHFSFSAKWMVMKQAAESVRSEIFKYRSRSGKYSEPQFRAQELSRSLRDITEDILKSECSGVSMESVSGDVGNKIMPPKGSKASLRYKCFDMVESDWFMTLDTLLILASAIVLGLSYADLTSYPGAIQFLLQDNFG
jgi:hypothetical protein